MITKVFGVHTADVAVTDKTDANFPFGHFDPSFFHLMLLLYMIF